jgi:hypothetical protein
LELRTVALLEGRKAKWTGAENGPREQRKEKASLKWI